MTFSAHKSCFYFTQGKVHYIQRFVVLKSSIFNFFGVIHTQEIITITLKQTKPHSDEFVFLDI